MKLRSIFVLLITGTLILAGCASAGNAPQSGVGNQLSPTQAPTMAPTTGPASASAPELDVSQTSDLDSFLVDAKGMTLYIYGQDTPNTSTCYDKCATNWPPLTTTGSATAGAGVTASLIGTTKRTDGTTQVTYNGWPLYYFIKDTKSGDVAGQGIGGNWTVVSPAGDKVQTKSAPTTAPAAAPAASIMINLGQTTDLGQFLVDGKGMSLYLFTKDTTNTSTCYDKCAAAWPPLTITGSATAGTGLDPAKLGTTKRTDGTMQVTYNGWPLYYFAKDKAAGDVTGENLFNAWYVVSPAGDKIQSMTMPTQAPSGSSGGSSGSSGSVMSGNVAVSISNFSFNPTPLTVKVGSTVTWTNNDNTSHNVMADDGSFKSDTLANGGTFSFTFTKPGTYQYYCSFHGGPGGKGMSATITVVS